MAIELYISRNIASFVVFFLIIYFFCTFGLYSPTGVELLIYDDIFGSPSEGEGLRPQISLPNTISYALHITVTVAGGYLNSFYDYSGICIVQ